MKAIHNLLLLQVRLCKGCFLNANIRKMKAIHNCVSELGDTKDVVS